MVSPNLSNPRSVKFSSSHGSEYIPNSSPWFFDYAKYYVGERHLGDDRSRIDLRRVRRLAFQIQGTQKNTGTAGAFLPQPCHSELNQILSESLKQIPTKITLLSQFPNHPPTKWAYFLLTPRQFTSSFWKSASHLHVGLPNLPVPGGFRAVVKQSKTKKVRWCFDRKTKWKWWLNGIWWDIPSGKLP